jgi:hypothetical protein
MIKQGYDHFEVSRLEPKVDVCERRYVFDAQTPANASRPISFNPSGKCPVYEVPPEIAEAVQEKQRKDEYQIAELTRRNVPTAPIKTGTDGGMNPIFLAALNKSKEVRDPDGSTRYIVSSLASTPGTIPSTVNPPRAAEPQYVETETAVVANVPMPRAAPLRKEGSRPAEEPSFASKLGGFFSTGSTPPEQTRVATAAPPPEAKGYRTVYSSRNEESETFTSKLGRWMGFKKSEPVPSPAAAPLPAPKPKPRPAAARSTPEPAPSPVGSAPPPAVARVSPPPRPDVAAAQPAPVGASASLMSGAQPVLPASSFASRFGALR